MLKINGDNDASSESNNDENTDKNVCGQNEAVPYSNSYANYYAQWTPELYQQYGLPQDYYQHHNQRPKKERRNHSRHIHIDVGYGCSRCCSEENIMKIKLIGGEI